MIIIVRIDGFSFDDADTNVEYNVQIPKRFFKKRI